MKLEFLFVPTSDLGASLAFYRDGLGFTEVWREGDATVALALPGTDVQLMLDAHDPDAPLGPLFVVDSVEAFHASGQSHSPWLKSPRRSPVASWPPIRTRAGPPSTSWTSRRTPPLNSDDELCRERRESRRPFLQVLFVGLDRNR